MTNNPIQLFLLLLFLVILFKNIACIGRIFTVVYEAFYNHDTDLVVVANVVGLTEDTVSDMPLDTTAKKKPEKSKKTIKDDKVKNTDFMQEASSALHNLGIKKSKANVIVRDLCKEKTYNSSEDLLKDAIVYIG